MKKKNIHTHTHTDVHHFYILIFVVTELDLQNEVDIHCWTVTPLVLVCGTHDTMYSSCTPVTQFVHSGGTTQALLTSLEAWSFFIYTLMTVSIHMLAIVSIHTLAIVSVQ